MAAPSIHFVNHKFALQFYFWKKHTPFSDLSLKHQFRNSTSPTRRLIILIWNAQLHLHTWRLQDFALQNSLRSPHIVRPASFTPASQLDSLFKCHLALLTPSACHDTCAHVSLISKPTPWIALEFVHHTTAHNLLHHTYHLHSSACWVCALVWRLCFTVCETAEALGHLCPFAQAMATVSKISQLIEARK